MEPVATPTKGDYRNDEDLEVGKESKTYQEPGIESDFQHASENNFSRSRLVTWDGPNDPENPKNWPTGRKWRALIAISGFVLMSPLSTTIVAPSLEIIAKDLEITSAAVVPMILSIFMLGFACGPLIISPLSEVFGRVRVLQSFNVGYLVFNTACGGAQSKVQILVLRFLAGFFGSASVGVAPLIGPVLGPIAGGFLTEYASWRWAFYVSSIVDAFAQIWGLFFLEESYGPILLRRKKKHLMKAGATNLYTEYDFPDGSAWATIKINMVRPVKMLATQPVIQLLALYQGYLYGNIYILYAMFPTLWTGKYKERVDIASLNYLSLGIGTAFAAQVTTRINDRVYRRLTKRNNDKGLPEFRVVLMMPATIILAAGLFWYGWSAQQHLHWIMPNIGASLFAAAAYVCTLSNNTYIIDTYGRYSASGLAAISTLRCLFGFGFPIFSPEL
ncbi:MAG: hypothetical protein Q9163_000670 [Psora crenata]